MARRRRASRQKERARTAYDCSGDGCPFLRTFDASVTSLWAFEGKNVSYTPVASPALPPALSPPLLLGFSLSLTTRVYMRSRAVGGRVGVGGWVSGVSLRLLSPLYDALPPPEQATRNE